MKTLQRWPMKIPKQLLQFEGQRVLLLVTGLRAAKFYVASNGTIDLLTSLTEPIPKYSDSEGFFESSGHGKVIRSGSIREINDEHLARTFVKKTVAELKKTLRREHIEGVYMFSQRTHEIRRALSKSVKKVIRGVFVGDYLKATPRKLLGMIAEQRQQKLVKPIKPEAQKMLSGPKIQG